MRPRPATRLTTLWLALILGAWLPGCRDSPTRPDRVPTPTQPSGSPPSPQPTPAPEPSLSSAQLTIEHASSGGPGGYIARFLLRETGGRSGATIDRVLVIHSNGGSDETGQVCWQTPLRVPPNGELDTFYTDAGLNWLSYCAPANATSGGTVSVTFRDDNGVVGRVSAPISMLTAPGADGLR